MLDEPAASSVLSDLGELRGAVRRSAASYWYPMVAFGTVGVLGGLVDLGRGPAPLIAWVAILAAAATLTARIYRRRAMSLGVVVKHRRYWVLWLAMTVVVFAAAIVVPAGARAASPWVIVAVGYLVAAGMGRSARLAVLAAMVGFAAAVMIAVSATATATAVTCGVILIGSGLAARRAERAP